jgi:nicotinate-nucleotide--dimethylbenzimidazole phosphoribosyltransferase
LDHRGFAAIFETEHMNWTLPEIHPPSAHFRQRASARQSQLTKPPGSLGLLEELAVRLAAMQHSETPKLDRVWISVFAADHGIAAEGVSAFPQAVTRLMLANFIQGGAAISVMARHLDAWLEIVDMGVVTGSELLNEIPAVGDRPDLIQARLGNGTANFVLAPAMDSAQLSAALQAGAAAARRAFAVSAGLFIGGEMGIANTTSAAALACAILPADPVQLAGPGTGLDAEGVAHKREVIVKALQFHAEGLDTPGEILRRLGGFEIAALTGAYLEAAALGVPVLVDGFISSVAALFAVRMNPACADWLLFAHRSAEPGHVAVLAALNARPLLDLSMRLGEGSGAAVAVPILRAACALHNGMATFAEAGIPGG